MSGGFWDYRNSNLASDIFSWDIDCRYHDVNSEKSKAARRMNPLEDHEISELVHDVFCVLHAYDYWKSADIGESDYKEIVSKFKKKWFETTNEQRIENYKNDLREYCESLLKEFQ